MKNLHEKNVELMKRISWLAYFYIHKNNLVNEKTEEHYGIISSRSPPHT